MTHKEKLTPMMQQYFAIKEQYPDCFLFYRLGDFYEMFYEDAEKASRILEITLTTRNKNAENPVPMCGVPHHSAKEYIKRLIAEGHKVAICEQVEDPKVTKGMVKREVVKVLTPGTFVEDEVLEQKENHYIATVAAHEGTYYLAYADISTGEIKLTSSKEQYLWLNEIKSIAPKEIVLNEQNKTFYEALLLSQVNAYYSSFKDIQAQTALSYTKEVSAYAQEVVNFLIAYIFNVQKNEKNYFQPVDVYDIRAYLLMNDYTKSQLELTKSLRTHQKKGSLLSLIDKTKTAMGGRLLRKWIEKPLINEKDIQIRHEKVELLMNAYFERMELGDALKKIYDLERLVTKVSIGNANPRDLDQLKRSLSYIQLINELLDSIQVRLENPLFEPLPVFDDLIELLNHYLVNEPPTTFNEGSIINDGVNEVLDTYRNTLKNGHQWLIDLQNRERELTGIKNLKIGYNKVFGYFIELTRLQAAQLKDSRYERKQTLANNERFFTQELKELEGTILSAQEKSSQLEYELFIDLREKVQVYANPLQVLAQQIASLDVLLNFANISEIENYQRAVIHPREGVFYLKDSRHPVVEALIGKSNFVANDLSIDQSASILLLTGPNMSGKSTYMRQIAFAIILNQIGCFVPASQAQLSIVDKIFTRIGSSDDIAAGQSTFMVEMIETNEALRNATPRSLLLFDELGRGTATYDGMALAEAIIYYIAKKVHAATIFSTHYHELTHLEESLSQVKNIHVSVQENAKKVVFLHKIADGPVDKSYGIHVAELAGLPKALIDHSHQTLEKLEQQSKIIQVRPAKKVSTNSFTEHPIVSEMQSLDINTMTPIEAQQKLFELQSKLRELRRLEDGNH